MVDLGTFCSFCFFLIREVETMLDLKRKLSYGGGLWIEDLLERLGSEGGGRGWWQKFRLGCLKSIYYFDDIH